MKFGKRNFITLPESSETWIFSHMAVPTPVLLNDRIRVYVNFFDEHRKSRVGYLDLDRLEPSRVINYSKKPVLDLGREGCFDQDGVLQCSVLDRGDGTLLMYYAGFELGTKIRYRLLTGLAVSKDGGESFERYQETPILERSSEELYFRGGPFVYKDKDEYRLWYVAGSDWIELNKKNLPVYEIKYMESDSYSSWTSQSKSCINIEFDNEFGFGRPFYFPYKNKHYLFYSIRDKQENYKIGYAESEDSFNWKRKDSLLALPKSEAGFDSGMNCYASLIEVDDKVYFFYNGNDFGRDGFMVMELESFD
jgi:predicted GH43/DUF377 family glycosyl hydrolase